MPAADEVMLYKAFNSLFNSLFKWKGSIFLPFLNSSFDIVGKKRSLSGDRKSPLLLSLPHYVFDSGAQGALLYLGICVSSSPMERYHRQRKQTDRMSELWSHGRHQLSNHQYIYLGRVLDRRNGHCRACRVFPSPQTLAQAARGLIF